MAKTPKDHLRDTFDDFKAEELKKFKSKLLDRRTEPRVRRAAIDKVEDAIDLADLMVNTFTSTGAVTVTLEILKDIGCNELAEELTKNTGQSAPVCQAASSGARSSGSGAPPTEHFIDKNRTELIKRVSNVEGVLDELLQVKVITEEAYSTISSEKTSQSKMRSLFSGPIRSAGTKGKDALYNALKEVEPCLIDELESQ